MKYQQEITPGFIKLKIESLSRLFPNRTLSGTKRVPSTIPGEFDLEMMTQGTLFSKEVPLADTQESVLLIAYWPYASWDYEKRAVFNQLLDILSLTAGYHILIWQDPGLIVYHPGTYIDAQKMTPIHPSQLYQQFITATHQKHIARYAMMDIASLGYVEINRLYTGLEFHSRDYHELILEDILQSPFSYDAILKSIRGSAITRLKIKTHHDKFMYQAPCFNECTQLVEESLAAHDCIELRNRHLSLPGLLKVFPELKLSMGSIECYRELCDRFPELPLNIAEAERIYLDLHENKQEIIRCRQQDEERNYEKYSQVKTITTLTLTHQNYYNDWAVLPSSINSILDHIRYFDQLEHLIIKKIDLSIYMQVDLDSIIEIFPKLTQLTLIEVHITDTVLNRLLQVFPNLKILSLGFLSSLEESYNSNDKVYYPDTNLEALIVDNSPSQVDLACILNILSNSPKLKKLHLVDAETRSWGKPIDLQVIKKSKFFLKNLRELSVGGNIGYFMQFIHSHCPELFQQLSSLKVYGSNHRCLTTNCNILFYSNGEQACASLNLAQLSTLTDKLILHRTDLMMIRI